ncbi:N-acyl-D-aspartate/D-glutamate deacylase [Sphingobium faniae]|nr:N-acyl-D-aspartate/D-glutamate deacylase [Sphingobium faniae]
MAYDLVIRNGTIVDGSGAPAFAGDVAISGDRIVAVGTIDGEGREEIDATGKLVTPGFVDVHTHYDGQATWENRLAPSSGHGVTTVVAGNCGVGFAPVRDGDQEMLIKVMEGVEDIPEIVMTEGIPWNWETFPDYMDALEARHFDIDVGTQLPHSPLRVYVMGRRGAEHEASSPEDRAKMTRIVTEAIQAGALGVSTSRSTGHRLKNGELAPSVTTADEELLSLADGLRAADEGVFQIITDAGADAEEEIIVVRQLAERSGRPVSFTLLQAPRAPDAWRTLLAGVESANAAGHKLRGQVFPRPVGVLLGLDLSLHPFVTRPSYKAIAHLPLTERIARMADPAMKARILAEEAIPDPQPMNNMLIAQAGDMYVLTDPVDYAPPAEMKLSARAEAAGETLDSFVYDLLIDNDGANILYLPGANFVSGTLSVAREMMAHPDTILGLGDGGAHYGFICDASFTTYMLTYWVRDVAESQRFPLEWAVAELSRRPAEAVGLIDRGLVKPGMKADLNVIDHDRLTLYAPHTIYDLPTGGRRLRQKADGYVATVVSGVITYREGEATGALPGRLVRGSGYRPLAQAA